MWPPPGLSAHRENSVPVRGSVLSGKIAEETEG